MKKIEDFLIHPEFIRWVKQPDKELEAYWDQWRKANPKQLPHMLLAREILLRAAFDHEEPPADTKEEVLQEILKERRKGRRGGLKLAEIEGSNRTGFFWYGLGQMTRVAAILTVSLVFGWILVPVFQVNRELQLVQVEEINVQKNTERGEKMQLTLGDGTKVWLNSSSEVYFPEKFAGERRLVKLKGEAYFDVVHDSLRPFIVQTDDLMTTVLGTSFNVNTKESGRTKISLVSGKVNVSSRSGQVSLAPGEMLNYDNISASFYVSGFDVSQVLGWKDGVLRFHRASLRDVKEGLEDWYGVEINLKNARGIHWQFSGEYPQQMLEEVLESMSYIKDFDYQINDKTVTLTF
ncbi:FecR family protein [Cyclobacterium xiamenense]|uniref:FecR family protein n=1 Tax=Cyclobacterium xiamenense TaxID=1297121 RepID=UPI001F50C9D4|nr:FecR family protein [Cyclobacterium xiamenense]